MARFETQIYVYFAAEDNTKAWNGNWFMTKLSTTTQELFTADENQYYISWATGTIRWHSGSAVLVALKAPEITLV